MKIISNGKRQSFPKMIKIAVWERSGGICECGCGQKILRAEYDHYPVPAAFGGPSTLDNCRVLDVRCHRRITATVDVPRIAKTKRIIAKRAGIKKGRGFPKRPPNWDPWRRRWRNESDAE